MENQKKEKPQSVDILIDEKGVKQNDRIEEMSEKKATVDTPNYLDMLQRLQADFDNFRKHSEKEKEELAQYVRGNIILQLLPVLDDFERLLDTKTDNQEIKNGAICNNTRHFKLLAKISIQYIGVLTKRKHFTILQNPEVKLGEGLL